MKFQLTRPVWGVTGAVVPIAATMKISTHTPRVGRDQYTVNQRAVLQISTHTPRVGRDLAPEWERAQSPDNFNSHAPCGA